jgi:hypothetical protein
MKTILIITASAEGRSRSWHTSTTPLPRTRLCGLRVSATSATGLRRRRW